MLSLLHSFGFVIGFENDVSQQFVSDSFGVFVNVYVEIVSGIVTHVASESKRSAIARESGRGIK